jgi:hypothetical protein
VFVAGVGGWIATTTHARVEAPIAADVIDPLQMTINAKPMPTENFVHSYLVFN